MNYCHCGSGRSFAECCQPVLSNPAAAATAEALMRARYCAYVTGAIDFIVQTQHPRTRGEIEIDVIRKWSQDSDWLGLEVISCEDGKAGESSASIEFVVRYRHKGQRQEHHEQSDFESLGGVWYFVDGKPPPVRQVRRDRDKVGRNDPCPCGSERKYKKCCGGAA